MDPDSLRNPYDRELLRGQIERLRREAGIRAGLEEEILSQYSEAIARAEADAKSGLETTRAEFQARIDAAKREYATLTKRIEAQTEADRATLEEKRKAVTADIRRKCDREVQRLKEDFAGDEMPYREVHKDDRKKPLLIAAKSEKEVAAAMKLLEEVSARVAKTMADRGVKPNAEAENTEASQPEAAAQSEVSVVEGPDSLKRLLELRDLGIQIARNAIEMPEARSAFSSGLKAAVGLLPTLLGLGAAAAAFVLLPGDITLKGSAAAATAAVLIGGGVGGGSLFVRKKRTAVRVKTSECAAQLAGVVAEAGATAAAAGRFIKQRREEQSRRIEENFNAGLESRKEKHARQLEELAAKRDKALADLEAKASAAFEGLARRLATVREGLDSKYPPLIAKLDDECAAKVAAIETTHRDAVRAIEDRKHARWSAMTEAWRQVREQTTAAYDAAKAVDEASFLPWSALADESNPLPSNAPPGLRFGSLALSMRRIPGGVSPHAELNGFGPEAWPQPAILPFPVASSVLLKTTADQSEAASGMMQALMLRIATGIPPGQSRFTILDPLGLGKQFAGFMHLADHDELLVTSRIWTEPSQIEQRLADITEQMEVVIQKYLRNEYESIGAYNADAEVPEPYRFVCVANFPANFTETSARRLASIAASGARCGVYVILSVDMKQTMPPNFSLSDVEKHATTVVLKDGTFTWQDPEFSKWPLSVEQSPPDDVFTSIIQRVGRAAKAAKRVEVPFDRVAPVEQDWWKGSTASEVLAPLGPAGAKKLQYLKLGKGTSQHVLIAGKTGSGKSTLMHAMITSLALQYSPNEIQFYLIDFKKGVEFKLYDHYRLPHARVIAIESEREFGLSVLEQLDRELKRRGDLFRDLAVQDVAGFRQTGHADPMPRILLVIDEFQEIFVEDDKLAQDAALILDRLVRQGRAFGIHVLLGSQTLGGSYSLPRATMGQMAVRIALQCNEADSSLILSEENSAARLLTRPGEAIYNDANGMVAGNNPFQVVFLNEERRERYLGALRQLADRRTDIPALPRLVFDGNQAADPQGNRLLSELLDAGTVHGRVPNVPLAWLGDAIAIKDPTAAPFRRQGGANMLIVGQREDLATSLLAMAMVSLAAGHDPHPGGATGRPGRFVLLEPAIAEEKPDLLLSRLSGFLPHEIEVAGRLGVAAAFDRLAAEVKRRIDGQVLDAESVFVVIRDLGRFRELRKADGDFGFSFGSEQKAGPATNLLTVLKDGPTVGIHVLLWCDSLTNLQRTFERGTLKEFELRAMFQMSGNDSSQLVDSPAASKLGPQRALFIHEETGTLEKFRPYAFPTEDWLTGVSAKLRGRPQGTPAARPEPSAEPVSPRATEPTASGAEPGDDFNFGGGFGDFNFAKYLDDPPAESPPTTDPDPPSGPPPSSA